MGMNNPDSPVRDYRIVIQDSGDVGYNNRLLVATATTGTVRIEWVQARYGQIIPANWSMVTLMQYMNGYIPLRYQVDDAQNLIMKTAIEGDFEWVLLVEHDNVLPPDAFVRFNEYIRNEEVPVVSGLYFTRSRPSEPLVYRGRGTSFYTNWEFGDKVWVDGVPTGCLLIHMGIIRAMWEDAEDYMVGSIPAKKIFRTPRDSWASPDSQKFNLTTGTSDLQWCTDVMKGEYFAKSGWDKYQDMEYPFLIDTNIFCKHINPDGEQFP